MRQSRDKYLKECMQDYLASVQNKHNKIVFSNMQEYINVNLKSWKKLKDDDILELLRKKLDKEIELNEPKAHSKALDILKAASHKIKQKIEETADEAHKSMQISTINSNERKAAAEINSAFTNSITNLRERILRDLNYPQISQLGRRTHVPDMKEVIYFRGKNMHTKKVRQEYDDYVSAIRDSSNATTAELIDYAHNCNVRETYKFKEELEALTNKYTLFSKEISLDFENQRRKVRGAPTIKIERPAEPTTDAKRAFLESIATKISSFVPKTSSFLEVNYQLMLCGYLQNDYPEIELEHQKGSSRPDLVIKDVGIEVKGPTYNTDLQTIADKLLRYPQHFAGGVIIVLFDVQVYDRLYHEWLEGVKRNHPEAIVIKR